MPRNFTLPGLLRSCEKCRFNEAAADAAEFLSSPRPRKTSSAGFNEAAADAAEFSGAAGSPHGVLSLLQ